MSSTSVPDRSRPTIPDGYGLPTTTDGLLSWDVVQERLRASLNYWLTTVRPDGTPHSIPRWGVWVDDCLYYDGAPTTRHAINLTHNPSCTLTLESGAEVVIVEGTSTPTSADPADLGARLATAFEKYHPDYAPGPDSWSGSDGGGLRVITPKRALAWFTFPKDCTRSSSEKKPGPCRNTAIGQDAVIEPDRGMRPSRRNILRALRVLSRYDGGGE